MENTTPTRQQMEVMVNQLCLKGDTYLLTDKPNCAVPHFVTLRQQEEQLPTNYSYTTDSTLIQQKKSANS